ncbi:MAG TPA: hypothetical protein PK078_12115 [Anaerolineales bacterium]|nr:hypothetical protein [Anaerolineales bacterium]HNA88561.1 hypothetical protein [Anaerolineales bacterium]HNB36328.1 hypothetical protein [Anaerolineales bacterium]HNC08418.1 hypothetical protein [Anaerolineales bacterium]
MLENLLKVLAVLMMLTGLIWFFQGINILPGSFMTGDPQWALNGGIMIVVGAAFLWFLNRKKS